MDLRNNKSILYDYFEFLRPDYESQSDEENSELISKESASSKAYQDQQSSSKKKTLISESISLDSRSKTNKLENFTLLNSKKNVAASSHAAIEKQNAKTSSFLSETLALKNETTSSCISETLFLDSYSRNSFYSRPLARAFDLPQQNNQITNRIQDNLTNKTAETIHKLFDFYQSKFNNEKLLNKNSANRHKLSLNEEAEEEEEEDFSTSGITLCMLHQNQKFACTYYESNSQSLYYLSEISADSNMHNRFELANLLISDLQPDLVLTCSKSDENFIKFLKIKCKYNNLDDNNEEFLKTSSTNFSDFSCLNQEEKRDANQNLEKEIKFSVLANFDFNFESAREQIFKLDSLEQMPQFSTHSERTAYFYSLLNFECKQTIRCIGALLNYLKRNRTRFNTGDGDGQSPQVPIKSLRQIQLDNLLIMDQNTLKSLQIFNDADLLYANRQCYREYAANFRTSLSFNMNSKSTLYSLYLNKISTKMGIKKLRSYMLRPTRNPSILNERHRVIDFFVDYRNRKFVDMFRKSLKKCKFIDSILKKMRISKISFNEWKKLYNTSIALFNIAQLANHAYKMLDNSKATGSSRAAHEANTSACFMPQYFDQISAINPFDLKSNETVSSIVSKATSYEANAFERIASRDYLQKLDYLINVFERIINLKESNEAKKLVINQNLIPELDYKRALFANLQEQLTKIANEELRIYNFNECRVIYMPLLKFLMVIDHQTFINLYRIYMSEKTINESLFSEEDENLLLDDQEMSDEANFEEKLNSFRLKYEESFRFQLSFKSNDKYYYKTDRMLELDALYGDLSLDINDLESEILENLQKCFIRYSHYYADLIELTAELDCLLAFACTAQENNYVRPKYVQEESYIKARQVRHPLVELILKNSTLFIPNDVESGSDRKLKILTGPNASGKTIYLKQVALLVYMTMIGSYVAAGQGQDVEVGDFDRIFTRLYSNECIAYELSAFAFDMKQIADALNLSTKKSLLILDEVGKGTKMELGKSIVFALIKHFTEIDSQHLPHVFFSTHFYDLFYQAGLNQENSLLSRVVNNKRIEYFTLEFLFDDQNKNDESNQVKSLIFLYKLKNGITKSSYALNVAKLAGLPNEIVQKADQVLSLLIKSTQLELGSDENIKLLRKQLDSLFTSETSMQNFGEYFILELFIYFFFIQKYIPHSQTNFKLCVLLFQRCKETVMNFLKLFYELKEVNESSDGNTDERAVCRFRMEVLKKFLKTRFEKNE